MASTIITPYLKSTAITPHDSTDMASFDGIYVGGAGNVVVVDVNGTATTFTAVPVGTILPVRGKRVNSTSTTATNLLALYFA